jgi:hypothetical protein
LAYKLHLILLILLGWILAELGNDIIPFPRHGFNSLFYIKKGGINQRKNEIELAFSRKHCFPKNFASWVRVMKGCEKPI